MGQLQSMINTKTDECDGLALMTEENLKNAKPFLLEGQTYDCRVYLGDLEDINERKTKSDVYDGDTLHLVIIYLGVPHKITVRMLGIDTPEMRPKWTQTTTDESGKIYTFRVSDETHKLEKEKAVEARNALKVHIWGKKLSVKFGKNDKFGGRVLAELFTVNEGAINSVNKWMISSGHAQSYFGGKKLPFVPAI